jgi:Periplasmic binding protein
MSSMFPPGRIVCLTEETVETLYLLAEQDRIVGISGYVVRPPQARREKPRVSAFTSANIDKIVALKPDLVLSFSDLQADIAADLIRRGLDVPCVQSTNHRRDSRDDPDAGRDGRCDGTGSAARRNDRDALGRSAKPRRSVTEAPKGVLRGMGRSVDLRNWMGV